MEEDIILDRFKSLDSLLEDIDGMLFRWKEGNMIKHIDVKLFERVVHDRFDLERHLMIAMSTIQELSNEINKNRNVLRNFNEEDLEYMRRRIATRLAREAEIAAQEVHEVRSD